MVNLIKLSPELEAKFPLEIRAVRELFFREQARKEKENKDHAKSSSKQN